MQRANKLILILVLFINSARVQAKGALPAQPVQPLATTANAQGLELLAHVGGIPQALSVQDNYAYVSMGSELIVLDVSSPTNPVPIGSFIVPEIIQDVVVTGRYACVTAGLDSGLWIVDISNPTNPFHIGFYDVKAVDIAIAGDYAYLAAHNDSQGKANLQVLDISDPINPTSLGLFEAPYDITAVAVAGDYAYLSTASGLRIIDISTPTALSEVSSIDFVGNGSEIAVTGNYVYYVAGSLLWVINVSDPTHPAQVGLSEMPGTIKGVALSGDYVYVTATKSFYNVEYDPPAYLIALDISNPASPVQAGGIRSSNFFYNLAVAGEYAYVVSASQGVRVIDVSNPTIPADAGLYRALLWSVEDVAVADSYAYVTAQTNGLQVLDTSNPLYPVEVGSLPVERWMGSITVAGSYAYALTGEGLQVIDIADPTNPTAVGSVTSSGEKVVVADGYAYITERTDGLNRAVPASQPLTALRPPPPPGYLYIVDVSDPANPTTVFSSRGSFQEVAVAGDYAYVVEDWIGLTVMDVSNPAAPVELANYDNVDLYDGVNYVALDGSYAYIVAEYGQFCVLDVSDPANPTQVGAASTPTGNITVMGHRAYIAAGKDGLRVIDVSDPTNPTQAGFYDTPGVAANVAVKDDHIYVADGAGGLFILRYYDAHDTFAISGRVLDGSGASFAGVQISTGAAHTTTDVSGQYTLTQLLPGAHTLTPILTGYTFQPPTRTVTLPPDASEQNFVILVAPVSTTLTPGTASLTTSLIYTDTQGLVTRLDLPGNAVTQPTRLVLSPTLASGGAGFTFAGHAFELGAYQQGSLQSDFGFDAPVTVTLYYSQQDVRVVSDESQLALRRWTEAGWEDAANTCAPPATGSLDLGDLDLASRVLKVPICRSGLLSLFGPTRQVYLPLVLRSD